MGELAFERLGIAVESARGTAEAAPLRSISARGMVTPKQTAWMPDNIMRGDLIEFQESAVARKWSEWDFDGAADITILPILLQMIVQGNISATTPGGATDARNWTFTPDTTSDTIETATLWYGGSDLQIWQAAFGTLDELTLSNDASGEEGLMMSGAGMGLFPEETADTIPALLAFPLIIGGQMQLWIDTTSSIGTTAVTGRLLSAEHSFKSGLSYKYLAAGTSGTLGYSDIGRGKRSLVTKLRFEVPDLTQYNLWKNHSSLRVRVRHNGPIIESALRYFVQVDTYGVITDLAPGEYENTNRTIELTIQSRYDATPGNDFAVLVQNKVLS